MQIRILILQKNLLETDDDLLPLQIDGYLGVVLKSGIFKQSC